MSTLFPLLNSLSFRPLPRIPIGRLHIQPRPTLPSTQFALFTYFPSKLRFLVRTTVTLANKKHYKNIILGSGQAGTPLATFLATTLQESTALIESVHVGGTCINEGCTPTKTMVASARVAYLTRRARDYGVEIPQQITINLETVRKRKRDIVSSFRSGSERRLTDVENLDWIQGEARFVSANEIEVFPSHQTGSGGEKEKYTVSGDRIFVNVGCRPTPLGVPGSDSVEVLNSTTIMELDQVPTHLVVVGGGYVGCEFAQMFRRFGAEVTIVQRGPRLLGREDGDIADAVRDILVEDGINIEFHASAESVSKTTSEEMELIITTPNGNKTITASHILAAAGRSSTAPLLNIEAAAGVRLDKHGSIFTSGVCQTNVPHIYAMGDVVAGNPQFTHISYDDMRIIKSNLLLEKNIKDGMTVDSRTKSDRMVPYTVFIDPQLGRIGLTETAARELYPDDPKRTKVAKMPMAYVARALENDESRGVIKVVVDGHTKKILGAAVLGLEGGEVMTMIQIAMMGGLGHDGLEGAVFAHPGLGELLNNVWGFLE